MCASKSNLRLLRILLFAECFPRLVFPTVQQNVSILTVLPTWIETLGRKIDAAEAEKVGGVFMTETSLHVSMQILIRKLQLHENW